MIEYAARWIMNNKEIKQKVNTAMYTLITEKGVAAPVDVLILIGVLSEDDYKKWREGKIDYLERVCKINLRKLKTVNNEIRAFANKNDLKPSMTYYNTWGQNKKGQLRFSKSGDKNIEKIYATHYIAKNKGLTT